MTRLPSTRRRRRRAAIAGAALALLAFSMTTLWPVIYLYFDVCVLLVCAGLSELAPARTRPLAITWTSMVAASLLIVVPPRGSWCR